MVYWYGPAGFGGLSFSRFEGVPDRRVSAFGGGRIGGARLVLVVVPRGSLALRAGRWSRRSRLPSGRRDAAADTPAPKVVLIVGPAGGATPYYRRLADEAAAAARS